MLLSELLTPNRVRVPLGGRTKDELLRELVTLAVPEKDGSAVDAIYKAVREREQVLSTGIGDGVAIPHGKTPILDELTMAAGVAAVPVEFDSLDGAPVEVIFLLVAPESAAGDHVKALSRIARIVRRPQLRDALRRAATSMDFMRIVRESEAA